MLKALVSRGHPEFSSNRQQDAHEFLLHLINLVEVSKEEEEEEEEGLLLTASQQNVCLLETHAHTAVMYHFQSGYK